MRNAACHNTSEEFKSELCREWLKASSCSSKDTCGFAHGQKELTSDAILSYGKMFKNNKCRDFYRNGSCMYGEKCMFRHEYRRFTQLHRFHYTPQLYVLEQLHEEIFDTDE